MTSVTSSSNYSNQKTKTSSSTFSLSLRSTGKPPIKIPNNNTEIITPESLEIVKIDGYRKSLKENGFAELDIPKKLKKRLDKIDTIIEQTHLKAKNNPDINTQTYYHEAFEDFYSRELNEKSKKYINYTYSQYQGYLCNTIKKILKKDNSVLIVNSVGKLNIRMQEIVGNTFHKDASFIEEINVKPVINAIYPFLECSGTYYIPYKIKQNKYPETLGGNLNDTDDYKYNKRDIDINDKKQADNTKIFIFLTRKASRYLGADYDDKSLVHAVPKYTDPPKERVYFHNHISIQEFKM
jgi:hypothetical protein